MKIKESILNKPIMEEKDRTKLPETVLCRVTYNICNVGERNANKRVYERDVWDTVLGNDTLQEMIENRRLFGQAEHPAETQSDLQLTSHVIHNMWIDESTNKVFQTLDVLDTPMGRIVDSLLRADCGVGVSTRAEGDLEESEDADGSFSRVIPESYRYITTDFTADPSTFNVLPTDVRRGVASTVRAEMENKNATPSERKVASLLFESLNVKENTEDKIELKEGTKVKYEDKDYVVSKIDEAVGAITLRPDIEGREVNVEQEEVLIDGSPIISVQSDGTVIITPVAPMPSEPVPEEDFSVQGDSEPSEDELLPDVEEKCGKDHKDKKKMQEGMDQLVARKEELLVKKDEGKCTEADSKELEEIEKQLKDMDVDIEEKHLPTEGEVSSRVMSGNVLKKGEDTWIVKNVNDTGVTVTQPGEPATENHILWNDLEGSGFIKIGEKVEEEIKRELIDTVGVKDVGKKWSEVFRVLRNQDTITFNSSLPISKKDIGAKIIKTEQGYGVVGKDVKLENESTNLRIQEAVARAEKEKALETIEELSTQIDSLKNESSETKMKLNMLMKKVKEATSVYDEVAALRSKLEEKARKAFETKNALNETITKMSIAIEKQKAEIKELSENHKNRVTAINESNQNRIETVKEEYEEQLVESKKEGIKEGISQVLSDYVDRRLAELELSIGENTRALLDECESIMDVEDILEKTKDIQRRNALHSESIKGIRIGTQHQDPEQVRIVSDVETAFEGMG